MDPLFRYSGGEDAAMTPYMCLENCMRQQLHQRYDKDLFFGITQGSMCLCGYDYEIKKAAGVVQDITDDLCEYYCCSGSCPNGEVYKCGGEFGRVSVYYQVTSVTVHTAVQAPATQTALSPWTYRPPPPRTHLL